MTDVMIDLEKCPDSWKRVTLGSICEVVGGFANPKEEASFKDGTIPFVRMQDLGRYHKTPNLTVTKNKLNKEYVDVKKRRVIPKGSILIPRSGSVRWNHRAILGVDACIVSHVCALIVKNESVDNLYLYYVLSNFNMEKIMKRTTGLDAITFEDLKRIRIPLAPIRLQSKIASVLLRADELMLERKKSLESMKQITQSLFIKMFGDPKFNPKGWKIVNLGEFLSFVTSGSRGWMRYYSESGSKFIRVQNLDGHRLNLTDIAYVNPPDNMESKRARVQPRDVLISITGVTGLAAVVPDDIGDAYVSQHVAISRIKDSVNPYYLASFIMMPTGGKVQFSRSQYGQTKPGLNLNQIKSLKIVVPPLELQDKFEESIHKIEKVMDKLQKSNGELSYLNKVIMQRAFSGKLVN